MILKFNSLSIKVDEYRILLFDQAEKIPILKVWKTCFSKRFILLVVKETICCHETEANNWSISLEIEAKAKDDSF